MPARPHECFRPPPDRDATLWRYVDLPKLVSFLMTRSLHFTKISDLPDAFEGTLPAHTRPAIDLEYTRWERLAGRDPGPDPRFAESMGDWVRQTTYVNCWCCQPHESEALWKLYNYPSGVAIRTTFAKLEAALSDHCYLGTVTYLDYSTEAPPADNFYNLAMHKRVQFRHEHEVRAVYTAMPLPVIEMRPPRTPPFMTFPIDMAAVDAVVLSPYAPRWFLPLVEDLFRKYRCDAPVLRSSMDTAG